jgi:hypothetical protein
LETSTGINYLPEKGTGKKNDGIRYAYGFSLDKSRVHEEYWYYYPKGRQATIFERNNTHDYIFNIDKKEQRALVSRTSANALYLSSANHWNYQKTAAPFQWLRRHLKEVTLPVDMEPCLSWVTVIFYET